jgi:hypothetical protein
VSARLTPARLVAWSGAAVVVGTAAATALAPHIDFSQRAPNALVELFSGARDAILASLYLSGLAWSSAFLVFVAALAHDLRSRSDETTRLLAGVGFAGGIANACAIGTFTLFAALAAFRADEGAYARLLPLLVDAASLANAFTGFATAVCVGGFSPALRRVGFPRWLVALGAVVALHHLASAAALARSGLWSPSGLVSASAPLGMTFWVGCVAALAWLRRNRL